MTAREDQVTGDLATAEAAKAKADGLALAHAAGLAAAQEAARGRLNAARAAASASIEAKLAVSKSALDAQAAQAQSALDAARVAALGQIEAVAADAASDIVEKLTGSRPQPEAASSAARAALA